MHKLVRSVRFSVNPFLEEDTVGANSFCSKPCGQGLAVFFELTVGLVGEVDDETGFFVNVVEIDKAVRRYVVPIFGTAVRGSYGRGEHIGFERICGLLKSSYEVLSDKFKAGYVVELSLALNPFRKISVDCEDWKMFYISEKFEFAAMHKLWNEEFSEERNFEVFGKCANPSGHGHNYVVEVAVKMAGSGAEFGIGEFEGIVDRELISLIDHKNLNVDVDFFSSAIPTVENIALFSWDRLFGKFDGAVLHAISVWETDKTCCSYYG